MAWTIDYSPNARKTLKKLDRTTANRIVRYLSERIAPLDKPRQIGDALQGPLGHLWRYRVETTGCSAIFRISDWSFLSLTSATAKMSIVDIGDDQPEA